MKIPILKVKRALANETATTMESRMVKIQGSRMWAYGGTFCLSVPMDSDLDVGFLPDAVLNFYSLERENEVITVQDGSLKIAAGKRSITVPCLPASRIPIIDVLGGQVEGEIHMENLQKAYAFHEPTCVDGNFFGVTLRGGAFWCGTHHSMFSGYSGLPDNVNLRIPPASVEALLTIKEPVTGIFRDHNAIRFDFEGGMRLTSRILPDMLPQAVERIFGEKGETTTFSEQAVLEISKMPCHRWKLMAEHLTHHNEDEVCGGFIHEALEPDAPEVTVSHKPLNQLLALSRTVQITSRSMVVIGENFAAVVALCRTA